MSGWDDQNYTTEGDAGGTDDRTCYKCGEAGHISRNCPQGGGGGGGYSSYGGGDDRACYNCGETGHLARDCSQSRGGYGGGGGGGYSDDRTCYNCGEPGHISRDCPNERSGGGGGGGGYGNRACYTCGQTGHLARDCPGEDTSAPAASGDDKGEYRVYVGNLSWNTDEDGLREAFTGFGNVQDLIVMTERDTGRSRGFGYITYNSEEEMTAAIAGMDGQELDGRNIRVNEANSRGGGRGRGGGGGYNSRSSGW